MQENTNQIKQRMVALLAGLASAIIAKLIMEIGSELFVGTLWHDAVKHNWLHSKENWPVVPGWDMVGSIVVWAYPVCAGLVTTTLLWQGWPKLWGRVVVYFLIVALLAPMSWINYALSDQWLNVWIQAAFNLVMAVFFLTVVYGLRSVKSDAPDVRAIQSAAVLMLVSFGVFLPLFYTSVFLAYVSGAITHNQIGKIGDHVPLLFAGGAGAIVTFLGELEKLAGNGGNRANT